MLFTVCVCVWCLRAEGSAGGAHAHLWAVWKGGLCTHLQGLQEVLLNAVCQAVIYFIKCIQFICSSYIRVLSLPHWIDYFCTDIFVLYSALYFSGLRQLFLCLLYSSYNMSCTKRVGLYPPHRRTLENLNKSQRQNGEPKSLESKHKVSLEWKEALLCVIHAQLYFVTADLG